MLSVVTNWEAILECPTFLVFSFAVIFVVVCTSASAHGLQSREFEEEKIKYTLISVAEITEAE